jgi:hypothetical protein
MINHWASARRAGRGVAAQSWALQLLVSAQWTERQAQQLGIHVGEADVGHQLELFRFDHTEGIPYPASVAADYVRLLLARSLSERDARFLMRLAILSSRIRAVEIEQAERQVKPSQIVSYYRSHPARFFIPEHRDYNIVETFTKHGIEEAVREIRAGLSFKTVARRLTMDPVAPDGIRVNFSRSEGSKPLDDAIFGATLGEITGPKKIVVYYIFKVIRIRAAHELSLVHVEAAIRRTLATQIVSTDVEVQARRMWAAQTACVDGAGALGCRQRVHDLLVRRNVS